MPSMPPALPPATPPTETQPAAARPPRRPRRALRIAAWSLGSLLLLLALLLAAAFWWISSNQSLAFVLQQAARHMPAGQSLESRGVSGSLRAGGRIDYLRWQNASLAVEVHQATLRWQLRPLLRRELRLGEVHAAQVTAEHIGPPQEKEPTEPLQSLELPLSIDLPFRIDALRWNGPPPLQADQLAGHYRYSGGQHALQLAGVDIAEGHYSGQLQLQGAAPMTLQTQLDGRLRAPLDADRSLDVLAQAQVSGTLSGPEARLAITADVAPAPEAAAPAPESTTSAAAMQAHVSAHIAPWATQPVIDAEVSLDNLDLARLWPQAPTTRLSGQLTAGPDAAAGADAWQAKVALRNADPGPWDLGQLPVAELKGDVRYDGQAWHVPQALLRAGSGRIDLEGDWRPAPAPWQASARVRGVRPGELHTQLAGAAIDGQLSAEQQGDAIRFDLALNAQGGAGAQGLRLDRALAQGQWQNEVLDLRTLRIEALRSSLEGQLQYRMAEQAGSAKLQLRLPGGQARVDGKLAPQSGGGTLQARIDDASSLQQWLTQLPGLDTALAGLQASGSAELNAQWQGGWQAVQQRLQRIDQPAASRAGEPTVKARLQSRQFDLRLPPAKAADGEPAPAPVQVQLRGLNAELDGSLAQARLQLQGEARSGGRQLKLDAGGSAGLAGAGQWKAALDRLQVQAEDPSLTPGRWQLQLGRAIDARLRTNNDRLDLEVSAGSASLEGPVPGTVQIDWQPLRFAQSGAAGQRAFQLRSQGKLQGLPMAWAEAFGDNGSALDKLGISGDLVFDADWDVDAGERLRAHARIARQRGDLRVQAGEAALVRRIHSTGTGTPSEIRIDNGTAADAAAGPSTPAGLRRAELLVDAEGDGLRAQLNWDSERAGQIQAQLQTRLQQRAGGWHWADDAPLNGKLNARLPNLGVWSMLAPPSWRIAGTLDAQAELSGSRSQPRWHGQLAADQLALRAQVEGLDLRDGKLRATLTGDRLEIQEFTLHGGPASKTRILGQSGNRSTTASQATADGGTLKVQGNVQWGGSPAGGSGIRMAMKGQLRALRLLVRTDRQVTLSGDLDASLNAGQFTIRGKLKTDRAVIILPDETAPSLGSDVFVRSAAKDRAAAAEATALAKKHATEQGTDDDTLPAQARTAKPADITVQFDLGDDFAVQGRGITTRLEGLLDIHSAGMGSPPRITGEVKTVKGQYRAYGQQLDVETGIARFNGPFDNPALDILAIRPNIAQRAGVQITGSAQAPRVKLYSEPALSDAETLSWVVLGRASAGNGGEAVLMQQAALALLGGLGKGGGSGSIASRFGLDEIGLKGPGSGGDLKDSAITVGKRLSKDFYVTYERSLSGTLGTLYIFYDLTKRLTLRGQAGVQSAVDLIYTVKYD